MPGFPCPGAFKGGAGMNSSEYSHTQFGWFVFFPVTAAILGTLLVAFFTNELPVIAFAVLIILVVALANFTSLTVSGDTNRLHIAFGLGLIQKSFPFAEMVSCRIVTNPWYAGWGIRITPSGWLFNVSGFRALEIRMKSGTAYRIGSDEPEKLEIFVKQRLASG